MLTTIRHRVPMLHRPATLKGWHCAALALLLASSGMLAHATTKPAAGKPAKSASTRQKLKSEASGLALASETAETINDVQLGIATRVLTGTADCEFNQHINIAPLAGKAGFFSITHVTGANKNQRYNMEPRETATGAVRLEDKAAGVVWLQIPTKSMLMNTRAGLRMVDSCLHADQRAAVIAAASAAPGEGIGIVVRPPAPVAALPATVADLPLMLTLPEPAAPDGLALPASSAPAAG